MSYSPQVRNAVESYVSEHIGDEQWHRDYFDFVTDDQLAERLGQEFMSARYIYKLLRGLDPKDWLRVAQVRVQVLMYASIYEAVVHHLLFDIFETDPVVQSLGEYNSLKRISIPRPKQSKLQDALSHDGKTIIPTYQSVASVDETKVRFDDKANAARQLGLIDISIMNDLISIYEARNGIHIHAELRKGLDYEVALSKMAYRRMQPFKEQVTNELINRDLYSAPM
jgi:hypothetical protein